MGAQTDRTYAYFRAEGFIDSAGNLLSTSLSGVNNVFSGITGSAVASQINNIFSGLASTVTAGMITGNVLAAASAAYAVSANSANYAASAGNTIYTGSGTIFHTPIGGIAIPLINRTATSSVKGMALEAATGIDNAVVLSDASGQTPIGFFYASGYEVSATAWVVVAGIAEILLATGVAATAGDWLGMSQTIGRVSAGNSPPVDARHDYEVGHCILTTSAGGLTRGVIHFR